MVRQRHQKKNFMLQKVQKNCDNIVVSKLVKRKTNSMYLIGCLDKVIRTLVLVLPKMS